MKLYCATSNSGKLREFRAAAGEECEIEPLTGLPPCEESGETFEENAVLKAVYYSEHASGLLFAEDSGIEVDALDGAPGVWSARFAGEHATDAENNRLLIERLRNKANRSARYVCVIALARDGLLLKTFRGEVEGLIVDKPAGSNGFGYDPHFLYPPFRATFAELEPARKFGVSHRGRAFRAMIEFLRQFPAGLSGG